MTGPRVPPPDDGPVPPPDDPVLTPAGPGEAALGEVRALIRQTALLVSSGVVGYAGAFALNVLLARDLGASGFGAWVIAMAFARSIGTLGLFGAEWIVLRQGSYYQGIGDTARLRKTIHLALTIAAVVLSIMGVALVVSASALGRDVFHNAQIVPLLRLSGALGPVMGIGTVMIYGTQAFRRMHSRALVTNILEPLFRLLFVGVALVVARSQFAAFVGVVIAECLLTVAATIALKRQIPLFGPTADIQTRELVKFAVPVWGQRLMETMRAQLFPILLGSLALLTSTAVYAASLRIAVMSSAIITAMLAVYAPMGSNLYLQQRRTDYVTLFRSMAKWSFLLGLPVFALQVSFPKEMLSLFGHAFRGATSALIVMAVATLFNFATGPVTVTLNQIGRPNLALLDYVLTVAAEVGLGLLLIPRFGVVGAAIARACGSAINNVLPLIQVWYLERIHPFRLDWLKPVVAAGAGVGVARVLIRVIGLGTGIRAGAVAAFVIGVVYVVLVLLFGLSGEDRVGLQALRRVGGGAVPVQIEE